MTRAWLLLVALLAGAPAAQADDLIGVRHYAFVGDDDTLLDIARRYDIGYVEMRLANPDIDPWLPGKGRAVLVPAEHILPPVTRRGIVINLAELRLYYFPRDGLPVSFPIGIGREGYETPSGRTTVARKREHPQWVPTASERAENPELPTLVPAGPDNPMGDYALYLGWSGYAIHGTNKPFSVGRRGSHGCIRMYPEDIARLYPLIAPGTPVTVIDLPYKLGWRDGELYVEVHPPQHAADLVEDGDMPSPDTDLDLVAPVLEAAGEDVVRVDWQRVEKACAEQNGMPLAITRRSAGPPAAQAP
jgi:L,D-transpeptidase ErfK/SrfK